MSNLLFEHVKRLGIRPKVILELGSRDCGEALAMAHQYPEAKVYAFECNPATLPKCLEVRHPNITVVPKAVHSHDGLCTFYPINPQKTRTSWADGNPGASSLFKSNGQYTIEHYVQDEITVPCTRLDSYMKSQGLTQVDILWMDLQGAELLALQGMGELLSGVKLIYTEVTHKAMYTDQVLFPELDAFLRSHGFFQTTRCRGGWQEDLIYLKATP